MPDGPEKSETGREDASSGRVCEITPEMMRAGVSAFCAAWGEDPPEMTVRAIYVAMGRAREFSS